MCIFTNSVQGCKNSAPKQGPLLKLCFSEKQLAFFVFAFFIWQTEKREHIETKKAKNAQTLRAFRGQKTGLILPKKAFFKRKKKNLGTKGISGAHNCFGRLGDLGGFQKKQKKRYRIGKAVNFGKFQKLHPPSKKTLRWCRKGVSLSVIRKNCALLKCYFYNGFSKEQQLQKKSVSCRKTGNLPIIVGCYSRCKKVFFLVWALCCMIGFEWLVVWCWYVVCVFVILVVLWFCCCVFGTVASVLKCLFSIILLWKV